MKIGEVIRHCRKLKKVKQGELAKLAQISSSHLCLLEKGEREASYNLVEKIASALNIPFPVMVLMASDDEFASNFSEGTIDLLVSTMDHLVRESASN